jgi:hypothetical protein
MVSNHPYALLTCDVCGEFLLAGGAAGSDVDGPECGRGLLVFVRGGETVYEEPPLCTSCGHAIGMTAIARWAEEEEEG